MYVNCPGFVFLVPNLCFFPFLIDNRHVGNLGLSLTNHFVSCDKLAFLYSLLGNSIFNLIFFLNASPINILSPN